MKGTKIIDTYFCNYCGNEIKTSMPFIVPSLEPIHKYAIKNGVRRFNFIVDREVKPVQKDICPECQMKIAALLRLSHIFEINKNNQNEIEITWKGEYINDYIRNDE